MGFCCVYRCRNEAVVYIVPDKGGKLKSDYYKLGVLKNLTTNQQFLFDNGQWLWPTYKHEVKTLSKMIEVSTFCFLKQVLLVLVFLLKFTWPWLENCLLFVFRFMWLELVFNFC